MADSINIAVNVSDNGTTAQATAEARKLKQALQDAASVAGQIRVPLATGAARQGVAARAAAASPTGTASDTNLSRGVAGATGASGRDFAAQAQGLGGLVHVYATFAANLYAVSAAYGALSKAADTANIIQGLEQLGAASGRSLGALAKQMARASDGAISLRQAMTSTALATSGGMTSDAILRMTEVAKKASLALGRDMGDSLDRLTKGIVKVQPELLDELGIMARVIPSQQKYARELGKSVEALSDFEKRQAFANAVLTEGEAKFNNINIQANAYTKLSASLSNLATEGLNVINMVLLPVAKLLSESPVGLTLAVGTVAGLLLKQAIPALGQYKKGLEDIKRINLEKAANKSDVLTDTGQYDAAQADRSKQAFLDRSKYATKSAAEQAQLMLEGEKIHAAVLARNEARSNSFFGHETLNQKIINKAYAEAAASNIKSDVAQTQSRYGLVAAWKRLNEEINVSKTTGQLLKLGDGVEALAPKTGMLQNGFMRLTGGLMILGSAISTIIEAFSGWLIIITAVLAGISFFIDYNKTAGKEAEKLAGSLDLLNDASKTVDKTIDAINAKPFLQQLGRESLSAKANALGGVSDALVKVSKDADATQAKMGFWDKLGDARIWNGIKNAFSFNGKNTNLVDQSALANNLSTAISQSIVDTAKLIEGGPAETEFKASIARILGVTYSDITELQDRLGSVGDKLINNKPAIVGVIEDTSKSVRTASTAGESLKTAWDAAAKSWDSIVSSLSVKDPLGKLGEESMDVGMKMQKAFGDSGEKLAELTSLTRDYQKLRMVSPETQRGLLEWGYTIEKAGKEVETLKTKLETQKKAAKEAADALGNFKPSQAVGVSRNDGSRYNPYIQNKVGGSIFPTNTAGDNQGLTTAKSLAESTAQQVKNTEKQIQLLKDSMQNDDLYLKAQTEVFVNGAKQFENSIGLGFQKSGIEVQLKALSGNTTVEGIKQSARLQEASIGIQIKGIEANKQLIIATNNLARITEEVAIQEKAKEISAPGFTGNKAAEQAKLDLRSLQLKLLNESDKMTTEQLRVQVSGSKTQLLGKPATALAQGDPVAKGVYARALTERNATEAGNLEIAILGNTKLGNQLQTQKDLAIATAEAQRVGLEATLAEANARLSILSSLEKYSPIVTDITQQNRENEESIVRQAQQQLTMLGLTGKLRAEEAALAKMNANKAVYKPKTIAAQSAAVDQANAAITAQTRKDTAENSVAARKTADQKLADAKKNWDYEQSIEKQKNDWANEDKQNSINLASIKLGTLTGMKALQESLLVDQQRQIDFDKEDADYANKLANEKAANANKEFDLKQKMSQFGTDTKDYQALDAQLTAETAHYKKLIPTLEALHNARDKQISSMAAYAKAIALINEKEEKAALIRQSAETQTNIAQINLSTMSNTKAFLDDEIIARQRIVDLEKEQNSYTSALAATNKKYEEQLAGVNIALESKPADAELLARKKAIGTALKTEIDNLFDVKVATEANINATSRYNKAMAELTQTQTLAQGQRAVRAGSLANQETLGTISAGTAAIDRSGMAKQAADEQHARDTLGVQEKINELDKKGYEGRTAQEDLDLISYQNKLAFYDKQLGYQKQIIDNDRNTAIQVAINNLQLEEQARLTATASSYTENMTIAFGDLGAAIGSATEALVKMANDEISYIKEKEKLQKQISSSVNEDERVLIERKLGDLEKKNTTDQISNIGKIAGASKKFFDQKTMGYKVMEGIEKAAALVSAGIQAKQLAEDASNALTKIGIDIPAIYTEFMKYMGPWGPAAATAALAAVGVAASGSSSTGSMVDMTGKTSEERQKKQGTGGVFGDDAAKTTTIVNSLDILAKNSIEGLNYDNELLKAMRRVADSVSGAAKSIYAAPGIRSGQGFGTAEKDSKTLGSFGSVPVVGKILDSIFGGGTSTSTKITSAGIELKGTFKEVMNDVSGSIKQFKDVLTTSHTDGGWFGQDSDSSSLAHQVQDLGSNTSRAISDIFGQANKMFAILGQKTNVSAASINKVLETFDVSMPIDLMNKTGQELVDELNAVIGERISNAAQKIFTGFEKYRQFGEDYLGTVLRVVDGNDKVNQSLLSIGHAFSIVGKFDISEDMIKIAGGLEAFQTETAFFRDNFLTAAEKLAPVQKSVNDQLTKLGINIGITRDDFKQLVISQNLSTVGGREMYQSLMELAPGFDIVTKAMAELANKELDLEAKIYDLIGQKAIALSIARNKELAAMDASLRPRQIYINALTDEIAIRDRLKSAYDSSNKSVNAAIVSLNNYKTALLAGAASTLTPAQKYADAAAIFKATAQAAAVKITTASTATDIAARDDAVAKLNSVSDSFLANSKEMNAGTAQYQQDLTDVTTAVTDATTAMGTQLSDAKLQLGFLDTIAAATQTTADILTEYLTAVGVTNIAQTGAAASGSVASTFQIPGHADGGLAQGISMVGENGPELVDFKTPGRVYSNKASNDLFNTKELVEEIKALRKEVADLRADQKEQTGHLITTTYDANMKNAEAITTGNQDALNNQNWSTRSKVKVA